MANRVFGRRCGWRALAVAVVSGMLVSGCSTNPFSLSREAVTEHRARWDSIGMSDYEYVYRRICECLPQSTEPMRVEVRSGGVAAVTYSSNGESAASLVSYPTIDGLFDLIEDAIERGAAGLLVSYNGVFGYPTEISIDYDLQAADDEITIRASDLLGM